MGVDNPQSRMSIALCTYNGERFLAEQLNSFVAQQRLPDELVVCDDGSTDATIAILDAFARDCSFPVRVFQNRERLGVVKNFERAIGLCDGDIIVLSDQDDVWLPSKLECIDCAFATPEVLAVFSDADVVDASLNPLGYTLWQRVGFRRDEQDLMRRGDPFDVLLKRFVVMGASLAFRSRLRPLIVPIPPAWNHDAWIALIACSVGRVASLALPLLKYRQHGANQVGGIGKSNIAQVRDAVDIDRDAYYQSEIACWRTLLDRIALLPGDAKEKVERKLAHLESRAHLPKIRLRRIPGILREILDGGYKRFARNWGSIALDLLIK